MALTLTGHRRCAPMFTKRQDSRFAQLQLPKANIRDDVSANLSRRFCIRHHPWRSPSGPMLRSNVHKTAGQPFCTASAAEGERQGRCECKTFLMFLYSPPSLALTLRANAAHCSKSFPKILSTFADSSLKLAIKPAK
jgi:hypothetical protein